MIVKKGFNGTLFQKVLIIFILSFVIRLFFGCNPFTPDPIGIDFNNVNITGIDNSGRFLGYNTIDTLDTLYTEAVALRLSLSDTTKLYAASSYPNSYQTFSFQTLLATEIYQAYYPNNNVVEIKLKTLYDINSTLKAGDDISEHILCIRDNDFDLYHHLDEGISWLNDTQDYSGGSVILVLNTSVENTKAQFEVKVSLDNGKELSDTSNLFTIIKP